MREQTRHSRLGVVIPLGISEAKHRRDETRGVAMTWLRLQLGGVLLAADVQVTQSFIGVSRNTECCWAYPSGNWNR